MKNSYILKNNKKFRKVSLFNILQISLLSGLIEDSWILVFVSAFNLLQPNCQVKDSGKEK